MKKKFIFLFIGLALLFTVPVATAKMSSSIIKTPSYTIEKNWTLDRGEKTVNTNFLQISESTLPQEQQGFVRKAKMQKGVHNQGNLYVISRGTCPNPGYGMKIVGEKTTGEQTLVYVQLTNPTPGKMYAQVLTTPYIVAKTKVPTNVIFIDYETKQPLFE